MTTIAYHHGDKQIAVDSRSTAGGIVLNNNYNKTIKRGKKRYFMCGGVSDHKRFIDECEKGKGTVELECYAIMVENGKAFRVTQEGDRYLFGEITCNLAVGSGEHFAMAAMDFGKSAKEAVQYAAKRDIYTGGRIRVFNVK